MPGSCSPKTVLSFDHRDRRLFVFSSPFLTYDSDPATEYRRSAAHIAETAGRIAAVAETAPDKTARAGKNPSGNPEKTPSVADNTGREAFMHAVDAVKEHIVAGDIFQAVLSRRMECAVGSDPFPVYETLREINPSPYMYYLDFGDEQVVGASPEMLGPGREAPRDHRPDCRDPAPRPGLKRGQEARAGDAP